MNFIGRREEQKTIDAILSKKGYQGCLIYGRRRMGKTELIKHCLKSKESPVIIYQCKESSEQDNAALLTELIQRVLGVKYLHFDRFMEAVEFLFDYAESKPLYFVLDEYPYIRDLISGCDSLLQEVIDRHSMSTSIKFFVLGSSISAMKEIQEKGSPLYMRFTNSILLKQMDYHDSAEFYPSFSAEDKVRLYASFGGVPFYNAQIREDISVKENIISILSGQFSGLKDFLDIYLKTELRKINSANVVFECIALGTFHFGDILSKTHLESSAALCAILQKLIKMDLIEYVAPINDLKNKHKSGYRISDFALRFYYNFVYRNASAHLILSDEAFYDTFIAEEFERKLVPEVFECVARQFLVRQNKAGLIKPPLLAIGTFWYDEPIAKKNGQFDVVAKREDGYCFFECKFMASPIDDKLIEEEIEQVNRTNLKPVRCGFFSKAGYNLKGTYPYDFYTLADIYK